jgi:sugar lactone lactonase YvrE
MVWRGRIYSPLPFVRSLWGTRINAGVWGTAAFPSVYRTDVHPFAFLPHSLRWQFVSLLAMAGGLAVAATRVHAWAAFILLSIGIVGFAVTIAKNIAYARRSDVDSFSRRSLWDRTTVAYLHFLQPFARFTGQIRGVLSPPEMKGGDVAPVKRGPAPSIREAWRALLLVSGSVVEDRYWSETWTTGDRVLGQLTDWLRRSRAVRVIEIDEGWSDDRDISVLVGRWAWLDIRALVEDHGAGKGLLRVSTHLRPTSFGIVSASALAAALLAGDLLSFLPGPEGTYSYSLALRWPIGGAIAAILALLLAFFAAKRTAQATAIVRRGIEAVALEQRMVALKHGPARPPLMAPSLLRRYGLRTAILFIVMIVALGAGAFMLREASMAEVIISARRGNQSGPEISAWINTPSGLAVTAGGSIYFADSHNDLIWRKDPGRPEIPVVGNMTLGNGFAGDNGPATRAKLDTPDGVCIAADGDLVVADSRNDRIRRIDSPTGVITTIAGSGVNGYDGDDKAAVEAALNTPDAVACSPDGSIYIADTLNYRVRMIDVKTGEIHTVAGDGAPGGNESIGDGGPATEAHLNMPSDVAVGPNGDLYIADMHHNRVRKVDAKTHVITTVAGNGSFGAAGDEGPATEASLAGPAGIALATDASGQSTIYIADYYNGLVREVGPDKIIRNLGEGGRVAFGAPTRVAFDAKSGWLYVADSSKDQVVMVNIPTISRNRFAVIQRPAAFSAPRKAG